MEVFIVESKYCHPDTYWEIVGVFESEDDAIAQKKIIESDLDYDCRYSQHTVKTSGA